MDCTPKSIPFRLGITFRNRPADLLQVSPTTQLVQALNTDQGLTAKEYSEVDGAHALDLAWQESANIPAKKSARKRTEGTKLARRALK